MRNLHQSSAMQVLDTTPRSVRLPGIVRFQAAHHVCLRIHFQQRMEQRRSEGEAPGQWDVYRRGWRLGAADFAQRLSERLGRRGQKHEQAGARHETDEHRAERLVKDWMQTSGWTEAELAARAKGDANKAALAAQLRRETPMTRGWIAKRLAMGSASYVSHLTTRSRPPEP